MTFKIGQKVECLRDNGDGTKAGTRGTVIYVGEEEIGVMMYCAECDKEHSVYWLHEYLRVVSSLFFKPSASSNG